MLGISERRVYQRRKMLEEEHNVQLPSYAKRQQTNEVLIPDNRRIVQYDLSDGEIFVASDAHYWPGESSIAHQAFVRLLQKHKPKAIVMNGDVFDGARISRHEALYGSNPPSPAQEIEACQERLMEIVEASKNSRRFWTFGNHDTRLYRYIAAHAHEAVGINGLDIFDYFPGWTTCWRLDVNNSVVIKHRYSGGIHATHNNTLKSGRTMVTGHLHALKVTPFADYNGRRWGVDTGTLCDPTGAQFEYLEENPVNWCSGFAVLTFKDGKLLPPELCEVLDGKAYFRGQEI